MYKKELSLFDGKLEVSAERDRYVFLKMQYRIFATKFEEKFINIYEKQNNNIEAVSKNALKQGYDILFEAADYAVNMLVEYKIYDIDVDMFMHEYFSRYCDWEDAYNQVNDAYMDIILNEEEKDAYRAARKANRGRLIGGGFGLSAAAKGIAVAETANLAFGAAHGVFNVGAKLISALGAGMDKAKLYNNPKTLAVLAESIYINVYRMHLAVMDALIEKKDLKFLPVYDSEYNKAKAIFNNIERIKDNKQAAILEILHYNPFYAEAYEYVISHELDKNGELAAVADYFDVDIAPFLADKINQIFKQHKEKNDDILVIRDDIKRYMKLYQLEQNACLDMLEEKIAKDNRTYHDVLYDSVADRNKAEEQDKYLKNLCDTTARERNALINTRNAIQNKIWMKNVAEKYLDQLNALLSAEEHKVLENLCLNLENKSTEELERLKGQILSAQYNPNVADIYLNKLQQLVEARRQQETVQVVEAENEPKAESVCADESAKVNTPKKASRVKIIALWVVAIYFFMVAGVLLSSSKSSLGMKLLALNYLLLGLIACPQFSKMRNSVKLYSEHKKAIVVALICIVLVLGFYMPNLV